MSSSSSYNFYTIFDYDAVNGILIPKFDISVNGVRYKAGVGITRSTTFNGLNLFNYVGRTIAGAWDPIARVLNIEGFY